MKKLPVGMEFFSDIIKNGYYYVDKTYIIKELLDSGSKVTLFIRPRRFGKSLNIDMLKSFFEYGTDISLFEGLNISKEKKLCEEYQGKFPVVSVSLKGVDSILYEDALGMLGFIISEEARHFKQVLLCSNKLDKDDKEDFNCIVTNKFKSMADLCFSLKTLARLLYQHYGSKVIFLIDEYDVPLDKAYTNGYYNKMITVIRSLLGNVFKTNEYLQFAIVTGCLRISKESIFTGLNNLDVKAVTDVQYSQYFGFTDAETREMLEYYGMTGLYNEVKKWYDGYLFGKINVYCPWDVVNYVRDHLFDKDIPAKMYWVNTSGNDIIRMLLKRADFTMKDEIEQLVNGKSINKRLKMELSYPDLDMPKAGMPDINRDNLWSMLFNTGYLTAVTPSCNAKDYELVIPNKEIHDIFTVQISEWIETAVIQGNTGKLMQFCKAASNGDVKNLEDIFNSYLKDTISINDTNVAKSMKENFYHGILLGLLRANEGWIVKSNRESGTGYADIMVWIYREKTGCLFEVKYAEEGRFGTACKKALEQIKNKEYITTLEQDGMDIIYCYGVACYKKKCKIELIKYIYHQT